MGVLAGALLLDAASPLAPLCCFDYSRNMKIHEMLTTDPLGDNVHVFAAQAFAALGSEARLEIVRALVRAAPDGLTVGALQERVGMPASTLSHHVKFLASCGLITQSRVGRSLICRAALDRIEALAGYLTRECCADREQPASDAATNQETSS